MVATLTTNERQLALFVSILVAIAGFALAAAGKQDPMGAQGFIILLSGLACMFAVIRGYFEPEPSEERLSQYYDEPTKAGHDLIALKWLTQAIEEANRPRVGQLRLPWRTEGVQ